MGLFLGFCGWSLYALTNAVITQFPKGVPVSEFALFGSLVALMAAPLVKKLEKQPKEDGAIPVPDARSASQITNRAGRISFFARWMVRCLVSGAGGLLLIAAFMHLSLTTTTSLLFLAPTFTVFLSMGWLADRPSLMVITGIALGLAGCFLILNPDGSTHWFGVFAAIGAAIFNALNTVLARVAKDKDSASHVYASQMVGVLALAVGGCFFAWTPVAPNILMWSAAYGALNALGTLCLVVAVRYVSASSVGAFQYVQILWAIGISASMLGGRLNDMGWIGVVAVIASGLLIAFEPLLSGKVGFSFLGRTAFFNRKREKF